MQLATCRPGRGHGRESGIVDALRDVEGLAAGAKQLVDRNGREAEARGLVAERPGQHGVRLEPTRHRGRLAEQDRAAGRVLGEKQLGRKGREEVGAIDAVAFARCFERRLQRADATGVDLPGAAEEPATGRERCCDLCLAITCGVRA